MPCSRDVTVGGDIPATVNGLLQDDCASARLSSLPCRLEVATHEFAQCCPVPPGDASEPEEESRRCQCKNADHLSAEQDNNAENNCRCRAEKRNDREASQEQSPQCSVNGSK